MIGGFHVEPAALDAAARLFRAVGDDLARAVAGLRSSLGTLGDVCGGDEQGRRFAAGYQPRVDEGFGALDALVRGVGAVPEALTRAAAGYREGDSAGEQAPDELR